MDNSREKILNAAIGVFAEKGRHGARMEEIAGAAHINKAMLYYFFTTKDTLYHEVLNVILFRTFDQIYQQLHAQLDQSAQNPAERLKTVIQVHFLTFARNPDHTKIILEAFSHDPQAIQQAMTTMPADQLPKNRVNIMCTDKILELFDEGMRQKIFRPINPHQLFISIMGMTLIHFIGLPMARMLGKCQHHNEQSFIQERLDSIVDLVLNGILEKGAKHHA